MHIKALSAARHKKKPKQKIKPKQKKKKPRLIRMNEGAIKKKSTKYKPKINYKYCKMRLLKQLSYLYKLLILFHHFKATQAIHFHDSKFFAITFIPLF